MNYKASKRVTLAHINKLHTILGKLEYLQNILPSDTKAMGDIDAAKSRLMRALRDLESEQGKGAR